MPVQPGPPRSRTRSELSRGSRALRRGPHCHRNDDIDLEPERTRRRFGKAFATSLRPTLSMRKNCGPRSAKFAHPLHKKRRYVFTRPPTPRQVPDGTAVWSSGCAADQRTAMCRAQQRDEIAPLMCSVRSRQDGVTSIRVKTAFWKGAEVAAEGPSASIVVVLSRRRSLRSAPAAPITDIFRVRRAGFKVP